jgi:hypothetical protein
MFDLEDNLPDELMSGGNCWNDQMGNKGPGGQMNGGDDNNGGPPVHIVPTVQLQQRLHNQQMAHHLMQQVRTLFK